ncbi:MAG: M48 family metalloprotease [Dongiaceae bacterium]
MSRSGRSAGSFRRALFGIAATLALTGCSGADFVLPELSDADVNRASLTIGSASSYLPRYLRTEAESRQLLRRIADRLQASAPALCQHAKVKSCRINITYSSDGEVNAYASGKDSVVVQRGLLELLQSEEEVAAVVAHEYGHHLGRHIEEKQRNAAIGAILVGLAAAGGAMAAGADGNDPAMTNAVGTWAGVGAQIGALSYSKSQEREADLLSAYLLARAGYDLRKAGHVWQVLAQLDKKKTKASLFDTHPAGPERMAAWERAIVEVEHSPTKLPPWKS